MENLSVIEHLPGLILAKDINFTILNASQAVAKLVGWKHGKILGIKDYDIPCKASESASQFVNLDKKVINTQQKMLTLDIQHYDQGWAALLVERTPIIEQTTGQSTGIISQAIDVSTTHLAKSLFGVCLSDNKIIIAYNKPAIYILSEAYAPIKLPKRQQECLFLLIRGKSMKEIARILKISNRTVEEYLDVLKVKLNCTSKSQIIECAVNLGFLYYIPQSFL